LKRLLKKCCYGHTVIKSTPLAGEVARLAPQ